MAEAVTKLAVKNEDKKPEGVRSVAPAGVWPFANLRREIDRLFDDFTMGPWRSPTRHSLFDVDPFWRGGISWSKVPAVDVVDTGKGYERRKSRSRSRKVELVHRAGLARVE